MKRVEEWRKERGELLAKHEGRHKRKANAAEIDEYACAWMRWLDRNTWNKWLNGTVCIKILCALRLQASSLFNIMLILHCRTPISKAASPPSQTLIHLILPYLYDLDQHPPAKSANAWLASGPLIAISSISSKLFLPQKSFTPFTKRLLKSSTSGSSTAAKQTLRYAQPRSSLISSVGANMEPGMTSKRYFFVVKCTHNPRASLAGVVLFHNGWEGRLRWTLTGVRPKTLWIVRDQGAWPYEHASERPCEIKESDFVNDAPITVDALAAAGPD